ncbi:hypothetical protein [Adlercreutzia murintestinalis]|uniref:hypothetical protein n=1 Tax=Adlercreutzia murintestinalis TaxID=2941325 RepID=UPI0020424345|nr:hypothetical protein [Adlercreutzia murintestinalis]
MANEYRKDAGNPRPVSPSGAYGAPHYPVGQQANMAAPQMAQRGQAPQPVPQPGFAAPGSAQQPPEEKKRRRGAGFWIGIVVALVAIILAIVLAFILLGGNDEQGRRAGTLGQLEGKTEEEIVAELNRAVDEGMFNISISSNVTFEDGTSEGDLRIENVPGNRYLMQVDIKRDDTGETIYESGILEPNYHIQSDKLSTDLDAGTYECTAEFHALDPDSEEEVGTAAAKLVINVAN